MTFTLLTEHEFETFVHSQPKTSFEQSLEMAKLRQSRGYNVQFLGLKNGTGEVTVAALAYSQKLFGGIKMEIYWGPVYTSSSYLVTFLKELKHYAKQQNVLELAIIPNEVYQLFDNNGEATSQKNDELLSLYQTCGFSHQGFQIGYDGSQLFWQYVKDLSDLTPENLRKSYTKKGTPLANKTASFGIKLKKLEREQLHLFKGITSTTSQRRNYADKSLEYYQLFFDAFGDRAEFMLATINFQDYYSNLDKEQQKLVQKIERLKVDLEVNPASVKKQNQLREFTDQFNTFTTRKEEAQEFINQYGTQDTPLAASLFVYTPQEAVYLYSGSYTEFNRFYAPVALQEHVMQTAISKEISFYNLLGITGQFDGSDGVLRFKQNFNGYIIRKMGTFLYHPSPVKYRVIQVVKKILGRR